MFSTRVGARALRQGATNGTFFQQNIPKMALAARISTTQSRPVATTKVSNEDGHQILVNQRLNRPIAPHLGIYKMEQTWFSHSAWTRITGVTLSGASYVFFSAYLVAPLFGWHIESATMASAAAGLPFLVKGGLKFLLAFPFSYHFINGTRHLIFDLGIGYAKKTFTKAEAFVWSASGLLGMYFAFGV